MSTFDADLAYLKFLAGNILAAGPLELGVPDEDEIYFDAKLSAQQWIDARLRDDPWIGQ